MNTVMQAQQQHLCSLSDLVANSGVAALWQGQQIALFYLPDTPEQVFALSNYDPFSYANVISRGIVGDLQGEPVVASPIYKQHFTLSTGACLEEPDVHLPVYQVALRDDELWLRA